MLAYVIDKPFIQTFSCIDLFELRFDLCGWCQPKGKKWILTIRRKKDRGNFEGSEKDRFQLFEKLLTLNPDYVDLESDVPIDFAKKIKQSFPKIQLIRSFHDFESTPSDLETLFSSIYHPLFDIYKIATFANSVLDSLKMIKFVQSCKYPISGICMGEKGTITRLGPIFGNVIDYTSDRPVNGQISLNELINVYQYPSISKHTKIFALIGYPVAHSIGHLFHNWFFQETQKNAVYLKIPIKDHELFEFFSMIQSLPVEGLSITTPLKEEIQKYCLTVHYPINTLTFQNDQWLGFNTDGKGAMLSLHQLSKIKGKKVLILGAGATAKAIIEEGIKHKLSLSVFNRNYQKAKQNFGIKVEVLKKLISANYFDILINATSCGSQNDISPIEKKWIEPHLIVLDVVYKNTTTTLIKDAQEKGCKTLSGLSLFYYQALLQQQIWQRKKFSESYISKFKKIWKQDQHLLRLQY